MSELVNRGALRTSVGVPYVNLGSSSAVSGARLI